MEADSVGALRRPAHRPTAPAPPGSSRAAAPRPRPHGSCVCPVAPGVEAAYSAAARALGPELPNQHHSLAPLLVGSPCPRWPEAPHPAWGSHGLSQGGCPSRWPVGPHKHLLRERGWHQGQACRRWLRFPALHTPFITLSSLGCGAARRRRQALQWAQGEGWGRGQAGWGGGSPPGTPPPPYPFLSSGFLWVSRPFHGGLQELDDADTAERGISLSFRRAALQPRVLCGSAASGGTPPRPRPRSAQAPPPVTYRGWAGAAVAAGSR